MLSAEQRPETIEPAPAQTEPTSSAELCADIPNDPSEVVFLLRRAIAAFREAGKPSAADRFSEQANRMIAEQRLPYYCTAFQPMNGRSEALLVSNAERHIQKALAVLQEECGGARETAALQQAYDAYVSEKIGETGMQETDPWDFDPYSAFSGMDRHWHC